MHLVDEDGTVYRGAAAGREVLARLPRGRLWALPFRLPGALAIAEPVYGWITRRWGPVPRERQTPRRRLGARIGRTAVAARLTSRAARRWVASRMREVGRDELERARLRAAFHLRTAEDVTAAMGAMKGAMMKLAQMVSYVDAGVPEPYRETLARLQADAPPMTYALAADVVREELGGPPEDVFERFDPEPLAAASIGQVHAARTHDGADVVVKVQYPGAAEAMQADLDNVDLLYRVLSLVFPRLDPKPLVAEMPRTPRRRARLPDRAPQPGALPRALSGPPVHSRPGGGARALDTPCAHDGTDDGARVARRRCRASRRSPGLGRGHLPLRLRHVLPPRTLQRRPASGQLPLSGRRLRRVPRLRVPEGVHASGARRRPADRAALDRRRRDGAPRGARPPGLPLARRRCRPRDASSRGSRSAYRPILGREPFAITRAWAELSVRATVDPTSEWADLQRRFDLPADYVLLQRIGLGLMSVLAGLGATNTWRAICEEFWHDAPPATTLGRADAAFRARRSSAEATV